jgi:hypothetical protein
MGHWRSVIDWHRMGEATAGLIATQRVNQSTERCQGAQISCHEYLVRPDGGASDGTSRVQSRSGDRLAI